MTNNNCIRGISEDGGVIFCAVDTTETVREMEKIHRTSAVCSAALGRLLTAAGIMGAMAKHVDDSITLSIKGGGPCGTVLAVANGRGDVKGYVGNGLVEIPLRADGKLDVGGAVGKDGTLSVVKDLGLKEPYVGQIPLVSGEIGDDITAYYAHSEQVPTVCGLGVLVDADLTIKRAGGFLIQLLPGATEEEITRLEKNIQAMSSVTDLLESGKTPEDMMYMALDGFNPNVLDEQSVRYHCDCSEERVEKVMISLGRDEIEKMIREKSDAEAVCHFCDKKYTFDLTQLLQKL